MTDAWRARPGVDRYASFTASRVGTQLASWFGLPRPVRLRRYDPDAPLVPGPVAVAGAAVSGVLAMLADFGIEAITDLAVAEQGPRLAGVVIDVSTVQSVEGLEFVRETLAHAVRRLDQGARVVLIGTDPATLEPHAAATQSALRGLVRSLAKELRAGATANLVLVGDAGADVGPPVQFLLSSRSAYVNAQTLIVDGVDVPDDDPRRPLQGLVAVVTGAGQGIGEAIAEVLHRDGATIVAVDLPSAGEALSRVANRVQGTAVQADITRPEAATRIREQCERLGGLDILVHNAGITRDRLLVNLSERDWAAVLDVNLAAQLRLDVELLAEAGPIRAGGRVVCVSSLSGIAGNRGQTNYAASKAGVIGLVAAEAHRLAERSITCNAVAPGFIETAMTARMPFMPRELGRRLNSLSQGGLPVDVAEAVAFLSRPSSAGITGQVLRVCGQSLLGA